MARHEEMEDPRDSREMAREFDATGAAAAAAKPMVHGGMVPEGWSPPRAAAMAAVALAPSVAAAAEAAKAHVQMAYFLAMQKPRDGYQSRGRILDACRRPEFAERVEFSVKRGQKKDDRGRWVDNIVSGPSIRFAEMALREWGNVWVQALPVHEDEAVRVSQVLLIDLETNTTFSTPVAVQKTVERKNPVGRDVVGERRNSDGNKVAIVRATDEEVRNKEAAEWSRQIRNQGLRLIPADVVDEAVEVARATMANRDAGDPKAALKKLLDSFQTVGVYPRDLSQILGHSVDTVGPAELARLRSIYRSIRDEGASWTDFLPTDGDDGGDGGGQPSRADAAREKAAEIRNRATGGTSGPGAGQEGGAKAAGVAQDAPAAPAAGVAAGQAAGAPTGNGGSGGEAAPAPAARKGRAAAPAQAADPGAAAPPAAANGSPVAKALGEVTDWDALTGDDLYREVRMLLARVGNMASIKVFESQKADGDEAGARALARELERVAIADAAAAARKADDLAERRRA